MKQLLALMTFFLVVLLGITTVMAVGSAKQSRMVVQRNQQVNTLRMELRTLRQEQEQLNRQLTAERTAAQTLRKERNLLDLRIHRLLNLMDSQSPQAPDDALPAGNTFALAMPQWHAPKWPGEPSLAAQALENAVRQLISQSRSETALPEAQPTAALAAEMPDEHELPAATPEPPSLFAGLPAPTASPECIAPEIQQVSAAQFQPVPVETETAQAHAAQLTEMLADRLGQMYHWLLWLRQSFQRLTDALHGCLSAV